MRIVVPAGAVIIARSAVRICLVMRLDVCAVLLRVALDGVAARIAAGSPAPTPQ